MNIDEIRAWIIDGIFTPLRGKGLVEIRLRAGDLHNAMGLDARMPTVCNAMRDVHSHTRGVTLIREELGPNIHPNIRYGANVWVTYKID